MMSGHKPISSRAGSALVLAWAMLLPVLINLQSIPMASATDVPSSFPSDWVVSGTESYDGGSTEVGGNITILSGASLTLKGVTITMLDAAADGTTTITVQSGGTLNIENGHLLGKEITSSYKFVFEEGSGGLIESTHIQSVGKASTNTGLLIKSDNVAVRNSTISEGFHGVIVDHADPTFYNVTIRTISITGFYIINGSDVTIERGQVKQCNGGAGIFAHTSKVTIKDVDVRNNNMGVDLKSSEATVQGTTVVTNQGHGFKAEDSKVSITGTNISLNNGMGLQLISSTVSLERVVVGHNGEAGVSIEDTTVTVHNSTFTSNNGQDIAVMGPTVTSFSKIYLINVTYDTFIAMANIGKYWLSISWYLNVKVAWALSGAVVPEARVWVSANDDKVVFDGFTDVSGVLTNIMVLSERADEKETSRYSPFTVTIEKDGLRNKTVLDVEDGASIELDLRQPNLAILSPMDGIVTNDPTLSIIGTTDAEDVWVNGKPVDNDDGWFEYPVELVEGPNEYDVTVIDLLGNTNMVHLTVNLDTVAPELTVTSPQVITRTNDGHITVAGVTEPGAKLFVNALPYWDGPVPTTANGSFSIPISLTVDGNYTITVTSIDLAGNSVRTSRVVYLDTTRPWFSITEPLNGLVTNRATITVKGYLPIPTEAGIMVYMDDQLMLFDALSGKFSGTLLLSEGINDIELRAVDISGNVYERAITVTLDVTPPNISDVQPTDGTLLSDPYTEISGHVDTLGAITLNGRSLPLQEIGAGDWTFSGVVDGLSEGDNIIELTATDQAGNTITMPLHIKVDTTPPDLKISTETSYIETNNPIVTIKGTLEKGSTLYVFGMRALAIFDGEQFTLEYNVPLDGLNNIELEAKDKAGNIATDSVMVFLDRHVEMTVTGTQDLGDGVYRVWGFAELGSVLTIAGVTVYPDEMENGYFDEIVRSDTNEITISAVDAFGNQYETTATVAPLPVEVASTGPSVGFYMSVSVLLMVMVVGVGGNTERGRLFLLTLLFIPLYTKMKKNTVLEHYTRGQIHGYIVANPGDHYNSIKEALKLNNGTLAYHLRVLEKEGVIKSRSDGVFKRFYPAGMKVVENDGDNLTEIQKIIIKHVNETPGISQKDLSHLLGVSPSTVNYHIGILITKGILHSERRGMRVGYFIDRPEVVEGIKNEKRMEKRALKRARSNRHVEAVMPGGGEHE